MTGSFSELRAKEVIRICDAACVGCAADLLLDAERGCICALCVMPLSGFGAFFGGARIVIPWERVRCIGKDTILVDVSAEDCRCQETVGGYRGRFRRRS